MDVWSSSYDYLQLLIYGWPFSLYLSIGSVLELLVIKNAAECISQRLKWTSGARVMIIFDRCSFPDVLPETMKMFNYLVSEFQFSGIIWGVRISNSELADELCGGFEFRITDSRQIAIVGSSDFELILKGITTEHFHCFREYFPDDKETEQSIGGTDIAD